VFRGQYCHRVGDESLNRTVSAQKCLTVPDSRAGQEFSHGLDPLLPCRSVLARLLLPVLAQLPARQQFL
jgi:hypothetical protein